MGLFDIFKKKQNPLEEMIARLNDQMYPKGKKDIIAGVNEVSAIIGGRASEETVRTIFLRANALANTAENFDEQRLELHLKGYAIEYFNAAKIKQLHNYLLALKSARVFSNRTPSEVTRNGDTYLW